MGRSCWKRRLLRADAEGRSTLVSGGAHNIASGLWSPVTGGAQNEANSTIAAILGGSGGGASGELSIVRQCASWGTEIGR